MKAFEFDHNLIDYYARFSRSFSTIRAPDIAAEVTRQYDDGRFWPDALLSLNPRFLSGPTVDDLVASGDIDDATARIFRIGATPIRFHRHQAQSIAKARAGQSFVVTTGTGSGKSLCFFVPVVDAIVRSRKAGQPRKTRAIIVYPMNALANSQIKEIDKFISQSGLPEELKPVVRRYTGQESQEERQRIADNPPDILLTNFMMAELLLTRQDALDTKVIDNASGLEFIVLDELHTYRGRQGADVAILVRRLRNRCAPAKAPICIGTSATMASEGSEAGRAKAVADVASRLFGASIGPDAVIDESLQRATDDRLKLEDVRPQLAPALGSGLPETLTDEALRRHPLAVWAELAIGLDDGQELKRKKPVPFDDAVEQLAQDSGLDKEACRTGFEQFLTRVSLPETERGGAGSGAFLAFKLHRFISGAGEIFTTLTGRPRRVLFEGQLEDPDAPGHRLYPTRFCRECGHEVHVVTKSEDADGLRFLPRNIDDTPIQDPDGDIAGYLTPVGGTDPDYAFTGEVETYPEDWREERNGVERLRANRKGRLPEQVTVRPDGRYSPDGLSFWFIPGKFGFCPCCLDQPQAIGFQGAMDAADDVATLPHGAQRRLQPRVQFPDARSLFRGEAHLLQPTQTTQTQGPVKLPPHLLRFGTQVEQTVLGLRDHRAIDLGEPVLVDLGHKLAGLLAFRDRAKFQSRKRARPLPDAMGEVVAIDDEGFALIIATTHDDMDMGMARVVVVDGDPVELCAEVGFDAAHEVAGMPCQVGKFRGILGRDDEPELMAIVASPREEGLAVGLILGRGIKLSWRTVAGCAVALDVAQMGGPLPAAARLPDIAGLHHDPAHARRAVSPAAREATGADEGRAPPAPDAGPFRTPARRLRALPGRIGSGTRGAKGRARRAARESVAVLAGELLRTGQKALGLARFRTVRSDGPRPRLEPVLVIAAHGAVRGSRGACGQKTWHSAANSR